MKKREEIIGIFLILIVVYLISIAIATTSVSENEMNLTIWDDTDMQLTKYSGSIVHFYANFTNATGEPFSNNNCTIRFNYTGDWTGWYNMTYNLTYERFQYNRTFDYKGIHHFNINCTNSSSINTTDNFNISNTIPVISTNPGGWIDIDGDDETPDTWSCTEDTLCSYNFSANITDPDINDVLVYSNDTNTTLTNFTLNSSSGILEINIEEDNYTGNKQIELKVRDDESLWQSALLDVNITAVNDAPYFINLTDQEFNISELFEYMVDVEDEENNTPFNLNISFENCSTAEWSDRNSTNCALFNESNYIFDNSSGLLNISFTPVKNDVGNYTINFTVTDSGSPNATNTTIVVFRVLNINSRPYFRYVCDNERNATEDSEFTCWINASDEDETNNLTFSVNYSWFIFNASGTNTTSVECNISTDYNASAMINFTANDSQVGNWSINITVADTGGEIGPVMTNSTQFWFYIENVNDSVYLNPIDNITAYTSENYTNYTNASDDDLLIPDKDVFNESLSFYSNNSNVSVSVYEIIQGENITTANIWFNPSDLGIGNHSINMSVYDLGNYSSYSQVFNIEILNNSAPEWNESLNLSYELNESLNASDSFTLNLSEYVSDADEDTITFSYSLFDSFPGFFLNTTSGIINFTTNDSDVGFHQVNITATDGKTPSDIITMNFTINNINDIPVIDTPLEVNEPNAVIDANSNINTSEDNLTQIAVYVYDSDFLIPDSQVSNGFYNESLNLTRAIINSTGQEVDLFNFSITWSANDTSNLTIFQADFTPNKTQIGSYNVTINITDANNATDTINLNLTIFEINHAPNLSYIDNQTYSFEEVFYLDINASDLEDGDDSSGNLTFAIESLTINGDFLIINSTTGVINLTLNQTYAGIWEYNVSVNDSQDLTDFQIFRLTVYDYPQILFPEADYEFSLKENETYNLTFSINHSVQDELNYSLYIRDILRNTTTGYGNSTNFSWQFRPNFTDETTCIEANLTLNVSNSKLSNSTTWNVTINHTNSPLVFSTNISSLSGGSPITLYLSNHFEDIDASDSCHNQTIGFNYGLLNSSGGAITVTIVNWTNGTTPYARFSASSSGSATYNITAYEYNESNSSQVINNVTSNNFSVEIEVTEEPQVVLVPTPGGGGTVIKHVSLRIIVPREVIIYDEESIQVPIEIQNNGQVNLQKIDLSSIVLFNEVLTDKVRISMAKSYIDELAVGASENLSIVIHADTRRSGRYKATIYANVTTPKFFDWGDFYIELRRTNETEAEQLLIFAEKLVSENPECLELTELVKEARKFFETGDFINTVKKAEEAITACEDAISANEQFRYAKKLFKDKFYYVSLVMIIIFVISFIIYFYRRARFKKLRREDYI